MTDVAISAALTPREHALLQMAADGLCRKQMAAALDRSVKTVEIQQARLFAKLNARSWAHAVALALREGMIR